jgi:SAM-dependent methyltransferase
MQKCGLQYRFPTDDTAENTQFYQDDYRESRVTDLPAASEIPRHIANNFREIGRDLTDHLKTIAAIAPSGRLMDYGSSWGYCVYQFRKAGYDACGFEISRTRVEYGRKMLQVELSDSIASFPDTSFDVVYSAHCLEHIPNPDAPLGQLRRLLKPGGHLFIFVPNCGGADARRLGVRWGPMIGEKHVLAFTAEFFHRNLPTGQCQVLCRLMRRSPKWKHCCERCFVSPCSVGE